MPVTRADIAQMNPTERAEFDLRTTLDAVGRMTLEKFADRGVHRVDIGRMYHGDYAKFCAWVFFKSDGDLVHAGPTELGDAIRSFIKSALAHIDQESAVEAWRFEWQPGVVTDANPLRRLRQFVKKSKARRSALSPEAVSVEFVFDSDERVQRDFEGNYFLYFK